MRYTYTVTGGACDKDMTKEEYYNTLFCRCESISPNLKPTIDFIREKSDISRAERNRLYYEYSNGSTEAKKKLIEYSMRSALQIAYLVSSRTGFELDEMFSIALESMINTIEHFNFKNKKYFYIYIHNSMEKSLNKYMEKCNRDISLDSVRSLGYDGEKRLIEHLQSKFLIEYISKCTEISDKERAVIMTFFGLSDYGKYTLAETADKYHITESYARTLCKRGLSKLANSEPIINLHEDNKPRKADLKIKKVSAETVMKLQYCGAEYDLEEIRKAVEADCKAKNYAPITSLEIYIKPEDRAAYYVANHTITDKIDL